MPVFLIIKSHDSVNHHFHNNGIKISLRQSRGHFKDILKSTFENHDNNKTQAPLVLVELSQNEKKQFDAFSIHVSDLSIVNTHPSKLSRFNKSFYKKIQFGTHLLQSKNSPKTQDIEFHLHNEEMKTFTAKELLITNIKSNKIFITITKNDVYRVHQNPIFFTTSQTLSESTKNFKPSGHVIIAVIKLNTTDSTDSNLTWSQSFSETITQCKNNIISSTATSHFNSQGYIASFGNKGSFTKTANDSSINQYSNKKAINKRQQLLIDSNAKIVENLCALQVQSASKSLCKTLNSSSNIFAPLLNVANSLQHKYGDFNFKKVQTYNDGLWHSEVCINAITKDFHTENDASYTLISVPTQERNNDRSTFSNMNRKDTFFLFELDSDNIFAIRMRDNISFFFHGALLTHRQHCDDGYEPIEIRKQKPKFYNIACYSNARLFFHLRKTIQRKKDTK